jgi:DNA-binding protein HU-beta
MITGMAITRDEQIDALAGAAGITAKQARLVLDALPGVVVAGLLEDERITLHGLGTFEVARRAPRRVMNPSTGAMMDLPGKSVAKFKPSRYVRERVERIA